MSLIEKQQKERKTDNPNYFKEYRLNNLDTMKAYERSKYYKKKYNLDDDFVTKFDRYSGDVFKIKKEFDKLVKECPILKKHVLELLEKESLI